MKNVNIKKIIIFLLLFIIFFLLKSCDVKAATYEYKIFGGVNDSEFQIAPNDSRISTGDKFIFYGNSSSNYMYVDICTTGNKPSTWVYDIRDGGISVSTQVLKVNKRCVVSGYQASVYRFTFFIERVSDIGQDRLGLNFTTRLFSETSYNTYFRILNVFGSDTLSYADIEAGQNEAIQQQQQEANQKLNDINNSIKNQTDEQKKTNDTLTDDNVNISNSSITDNSASVSDSPISDLLILPIKLLNNISNGIQGTCTTFNLGNLFGTEIILPCINLESILGSFLWGLIDSLFCIFLIYNVCMLAIKIWTDVIMMEDVFRDLYKPSSEKKGGGKK